MLSDPPPKVIHLRLGNMRLRDLFIFLQRVWPQLADLLGRSKCGQNQDLQAHMYVALRAKGFATTVAIVIIARKLLRIAFAVWTANQPFDSDKLGFQACKKP